MTDLATIQVQVRAHVRYCGDEIRAIFVDVDSFNPEVRADVIEAASVPGIFVFPDFYPDTWRRGMPPGFEEIAS